MEINSTMSANRHAYLRAGVAAVSAYVVFWGIVTFLAIIISEDASSPAWLVAGVSFLGVCAGLVGIIIGRILWAGMPSIGYVTICTIASFAVGPALFLTGGLRWLGDVLDNVNVTGDLRFLIFIAFSFPLAIGFACVLNGIVWAIRRI